MALTSQKDIPILIRRMKKHVYGSKAALTKISEDTEDTFKVLISCILSLRTRDAVTEKASERLFGIADNPYKMRKMSTAQIRKTIYPVSFYRTKAVAIKKICEELCEKHGGKVPDNIDELMKFKGVGRKTANIVMVYGFRKAGMPVDTHVHRISNRLGLVKTKKAEDTEQALRALIPKRYWMDFNDIFVTFGQKTCKPLNPRCGECPVTKYCGYYKTVKTAQ